MHEMWAAAASTGQAMCGLVNLEDLGEWEAMVVRYPATTVVIDHFCRIGTDGAPRDYTVRHTPPLPTPSSPAAACCVLRAACCELRAAACCCVLLLRAAAAVACCVLRAAVTACCCFCSCVLLLLR
jgi:hypothetical protein